MLAVATVYPGLLRLQRCGVKAFGLAFVATTSDHEIGQQSAGASQSPRAQDLSLAGLSMAPKSQLLSNRHPSPAANAQLALDVAHLLIDPPMF